MINIIEFMQLLLFIFFPILVIFLIYRFLIFLFQKMSLNYFISSILTIFCICLYLASVLLPFDPGIVFIFSFFNWDVSLHLIGLLIPLLLIFILMYKKLFSKTSLIIGIIGNTIISFFITYPIPEKGIVAPFPFWLCPAFFSALLALYIFEKKSETIKAAYAYCISVIGVIIGADMLHLPQLLSYQPEYTMNAIIGGASMLDLIFITGVITVSIIQLHYVIQDFASIKKWIKNLPIYFLT